MAAIKRRDIGLCRASYRGNSTDSPTEHYTQYTYLCEDNSLYLAVFQERNYSFSLQNVRLCGWGKLGNPE
jgi:hypothetical protein